VPPACDLPRGGPLDRVLLSINLGVNRGVPTRLSELAAPILTRSPLDREE